MTKCDDPDQCPAVKLMKDDLLKARADYQSVQQAMTANTRELQETKLTLNTLTGDLRHLCEDLKGYKDSNKEEHDHFFSRLREGETHMTEEFGKVRTEITDEISNVKITQAAKLSNNDLFKIIGAVGTIFTIFSILFFIAWEIFK